MDGPTPFAAALAGSKGKKVTQYSPLGIDVSVVIPAFRAAPFIARAIDSAFDQAGVTVEVVVVDDACPLHSANAVLEHYGERPDLNVIRFSVNKGPAAARNAGFRAARGEWIAVLDADDAFDPRRLARLIEAGRSLKADVVADNVRLFDAVKGTLSEPKIKTITAPKQIDIYDLVAGARPGAEDLDFGLLKPFFRRAFVDTLPDLYPTAIRHGEDFMFYFALLQNSAKFVIIPEAGYQWTLRNSGQSQTKIDYLAQVKDTQKLRDYSNVKSDKRLFYLLSQRCLALKKLHYIRKYNEAVMRKDYFYILFFCFRNPTFLLVTINRISSKFFI